MEVRRQCSSWRRAISEKRVKKNGHKKGVKRRRGCRMVYGRERRVR